MSSLKTFKKTFDRFRPDESGHLSVEQAVPLFEAYTRKMGISGFHPKAIKKEMLKHILSKNYDDHFSLEDGEQVLRGLLGSGSRGQMHSDMSESESEPESRHHRRSYHRRQHRPSFHHMTHSEIEDEINAIYEMRKSSSSESEEMGRRQRGTRGMECPYLHRSKREAFGSEMERGGHSKKHSRRSPSISDSDYFGHRHRGGFKSDPQGRRSRSLSRHSKHTYRSPSEGEKETCGKFFRGSSKGRRARSASPSEWYPRRHLHCPFLDRISQREGDFGRKGQNQQFFDIKGFGSIGNFMKTHHSSRIRDALECPFIQHALRHHLRYADSDFEEKERRQGGKGGWRRSHGGGGRRLSFRIVSSSASES